MQHEIGAWLDGWPREGLRVVSACDGDGRDLLEVYAGRDDADRVSAVLLETDPVLAGRAADRATAAGLHGIEAGRPTRNEPAPTPEPARPTW